MGNQEETDARQLGGWWESPQLSLPLQLLYIIWIPTWPGIGAASNLLRINESCRRFCRKEHTHTHTHTHTLNFANSFWGPTPPIYSTSYWWLLSQVPLVIQGVSKSRPSSDAESKQGLNTPRKHLLMAAASPAVAAVLGGWGYSAGQRFWKNVREGDPMVLDLA